MTKALTQEQKDKKNRRAKARRINTKIEENGYVPTSEEQDLLQEEGFLEEFEPPQQEVKAEIGEEIELSTPIIEDRDAVVIDGEIIEITGTIRYLWIDEENLNFGEVMIVDIDGDEHSMKITSKGNGWGIFYQIDSKKYLNGMLPYENLTDIDRDEEIARLIQVGKTIVFRATRDEDGNLELWAPVSLKYQKRKIEDLVPMIEEAFPGYEINVGESSGKHGGYTSFQVREDDLMMSKIEIDGGYLDGGHSIRISGCGQILACANQLQMDIQGIVKDILPNFSFGVKQVHSGDDEAFKEGLLQVSEEVDLFREICTDAKQIQITSKEAENILEFYKERNLISNKVKTILEQKHEDEDIQQVPGTLWGLAMTVTWVGTHIDLSPGVKTNLKRMGGELLIVSQAFPDFLTLVQDAIWIESLNESQVEPGVPPILDA